MKQKTNITSEAAAAAAAPAPFVAPPTKKAKCSPLLGKPQNFYVPESAPADISREELSAWRKQERRKRNRASAAASRHKTQSKILELEGQVSLWKARYEDMQEKMVQLQRQVEMLTRAQSPTALLDHHSHHYLLVSPSASHRNSPSSTSLEEHPSTVTSSSDTKIFLALPPLAMLSPSSSMDQASPVENKSDITSSNVDVSKKHLNMISRQA